MKNRWLCGLLTVLMCVGGVAEESSDGDQIMEIEQALHALGYHDEECDARLDEHTRAALRSFQTANGLEVTGEPDEATLAVLDSDTAVSSHAYLVHLAAEYVDVPILQAGASGESVSALQEKLRALGYFEGKKDGVFGDATLSAVKRFQLANGLPRTGIADHSTQLRLNEGEPLSWQAFLESAAVKEGDKGVRVRLLQRTLESMGYYSGTCSGIFGAQTLIAVRAFQAANSISVTGEADALTCAVLYSGKAVVRRADGTLKTGDNDEAVTELQRRLAAMGYFDASVTGFYGVTTETAVRLFQMANGLPATGEADPAMLTLLCSSKAVTMEAVRESFREQLTDQGDTARDVIGTAATQARGRAFETDYEDKYEGFAFVRYICVTAGVPVVSPEDLMTMVSAPVENASETEAGDILAFCRGGSGNVRLAIATGEGRAVYATSDTGWVLESGINEMLDGELYRWNIGETLE